jgi:hypothetical protein
MYNKLMSTCQILPANEGNVKRTTHHSSLPCTCISTCFEIETDGLSDWLIISPIQPFSLVSHFTPFCKFTLFYYNSVVIITTINQLWYKWYTNLFFLKMYILQNLNECLSKFMLTYCAFVLNQKLHHQLDIMCSMAQIHIRHGLWYDLFLLWSAALSSTLGSAIILIFIGNK